MKRQGAEQGRSSCRPTRSACAPLWLGAALVVLGAVFTGCPSEKKRPPEAVPPAEEISCVIKGFSLGMPIRQAVDRVNAHYLEAFGPAKYKTDHEETMAWMESLPVKPVAVNEPGPGFKEYVYEKFHVVRYRDDGREYMFPFSPFMTDEDGKVTSIFLIGPIAQKLFEAQAMDPHRYLDLLGTELNVPSWRKEVREDGYHWWTAVVPGKCRVEVYKDKGVKVLPAL